MSNLHVDQIETKLSDILYAYYRLVLLVGVHGSGKTETLIAVSQKREFPYVNLGSELSRRLIELTDRQRILAIPRIISEILGENTTHPILVDNTEILFDISLRQDPLRLLQSISRNRSVVATWNGSIQGDYLIYANPGHPEYRRYSLKDLYVVSSS